MIRSSLRLFLFPLLLLALLTPVLGACGTAVIPTRPAMTPTRLRAVTAVAPVGPLAPTKAAAVPTAPVAAVPTAPALQQTAGPTVPVGPVAWTLTILHTGEVYGDVLPCG